MQKKSLLSFAGFLIFCDHLRQITTQGQLFLTEYTVTLKLALVYVLASIVLIWICKANKQNVKLIILPLFVAMYGLDKLL